MELKLYTRTLQVEDTAGSPFLPRASPKPNRKDLWFK